MSPQQMSVQEFAAYLKQRYPDLAQYPDQALVDGVLQRRPDLKSMIRVPDKETFLQKTWPTDAKISAYHPQEGLAGVREGIEALRQRFSTKLFGVQPEAGAGELLGSPALGLSKAAMGDIDVLRGLGGEGPGIGKGLKEVGGGVLQALELPASFMAPERAGLGTRTEMTAEQGARALADVVNPAAKQLPAYEKTLAQHLDKILQFAERRGLKIKSLEDLTKAIQGAGLEAKNYYYDKILAPVEAAKVSVSNIPGYAGAAEGSTTTLKQLDARLSAVNNELSSAYSQGGKAAEVAVKSQAELAQEAAAIRQVLYSRLSELTNIKPEEIANLRQTFGSLREAGDITQRSTSIARRAASTAKYGQKTLNPLNKGGKSLVGEGIVQALSNSKRERDLKKIIPAIRGLEEYKPPTPQFAKPTDILRTAPVKGESSPIGALRTSTPEEIATHEQRLKDRVGQVLASRSQTVRKPIWEMGEDELEQMRRGGGRPSTISPLEKLKMATDRVNSLKLRLARNPGDYNAVSQLQKAEGDLETLTKETWPKGYQGASQTMTKEGGAGANYTAEQLADLKKRMGIK